MADVAYGSLPFREQIAFFRRKLGNRLPTNAWTDIWQEAHDHAFVVAGANRMDLLTDLGQAVDKAIADGETLAEFRKRFDAIVAKHGWAYHGGRNWRTRVIYETNLRTSYAAGRFEQLQRLKTVRPYWLYVHADGELHPRPLHKHWGAMRLTLRADDPWWSTHYPPNGWGCKCRVRALNERDLKRMDITPGHAPPVHMQEHIVGQNSPGGPRTVESPAGVDPGFAYAPGRNIWEREQATRAIQRVQAQQDARWEPVLQTSFTDYGRPARMPLDAAPASPMAPVKTETELEQAIRKVIGADQKTYNVQGLPVIVDAQTLARHVKLERSAFVPFLDDLLHDPYEVWLQLERNPGTGDYRVRARLVKGYRLENGRVALFVADQQDGSLVGWTWFTTRDGKYMNRQRQGLLWWAQ